MQIARWQAQNDFDYNRELVGGGMTFTQWLTMQLNELLDSLFGQAWVGVVGWYLWRYHPGLFMWQEQKQEACEDTEDTIYGIDFDAVISKALGREYYREAVRMVYLRTLKVLSDGGQIDWQPYKTPSQYVRELSTSSQLSSSAATANPAVFRRLTTHFLRVRYGNFPATRELYDEVENLGKEVVHEP